MTVTRRRRIAVAVAVFAAASVAVAHVGRRDDRARFDHHSFTVAGVDGDVLLLDDGTRVALLGVADADPAATAWLAAQLVGRPVTLMLPTAGTRDAGDRLRAYAFDADLACVNVELVRAGLAYAERRTTDAMSGLIDPAETDARRHGRGLWAGLRFDQQPPWRQAWLKARHDEK